MPNRVIDGTSKGILTDRQAADRVAQTELPLMRISPAVELDFDELATVLLLRVVP